MNKDQTVHGGVAGSPGRTEMHILGGTGTNSVSGSAGVGGGGGGVSAYPAPRTPEVTTIEQSYSATAMEICNALHIRLPRNCSFELHKVTKESGDAIEIIVKSREVTVGPGHMVNRWAEEQ